MVFPWPHNYVAHNVNWGDNFVQCRDIFRHLGIHLYRHSLLFFPAGSFFWFRSSSLAPLLDLQLRYADFAPEPLPTDGTLAHALERCIALLVFYQNYKCFAAWAGTTCHGITDAFPGDALIEMPLATSIMPYLPTLFANGLDRAITNHPAGTSAVPLEYPPNYRASVSLLPC